MPEEQRPGSGDAAAPPEPPPAASDAIAQPEPPAEAPAPAGPPQAEASAAPASTPAPSQKPKRRRRRRGPRRNVGEAGPAPRRGPGEGGPLRRGAGPTRSPLTLGAPAPTPTPLPNLDWRRIARLALVSRALDTIEETRLYPAKKVLYQFSARGHELGQIVLGTLLVGPHDAASGYYRSRPLLLALGLSPADALAGGMAKSGSISEGRDIGAVYNLPRQPLAGRGVTVLPMSGGVGTQFSSTAGWARAIRYYRDQLGDPSYRGSIAVALGGEASVATNGFWSALTLATTLQLPMLFLIEDNGYGISVPGSLQTPGGNIANNLASFRNLRVWDGDGASPADVLRCLAAAMAAVRGDRSPALVRLSVPRLCGHSGQDSQAYKPADVLAAERARDPLPKLRAYLVPSVLTGSEWSELESSAEAEVEAALADAESRPDPSPASVRRHLFAPAAPAPAAEPQPAAEGVRLNMVAAIRKTLEVELARNPKLLIFGEDVGPKGGVHTATEGLQAHFGVRRVFDTSLSEEGIVGSAVGLALAGLRPVAELQFRKYADPATEQLNDCGTIRWRTAGRFSAPVVVRVPGGFFKCGDPWHSLSSEVTFVHAFGWQVLFPSNAADAVGLLRAALRSPNPSIFFEHRNLLDSAFARRPYPGDGFILPLGRAALVQPGDSLTLVTWGAMLERSLAAAAEFPGQVEILDLRTLAPWDRDAVLASVRKTARLLIVHEDTLTAGFGAEIAATAAQEAFLSLDAPVERLAVPDVPVPYNVGLMEAVLPSIEQIKSSIERLLNF